MVKHYIFLTLAFFVGNTAFCQGWMPVGSRSNSLANTSATLVDAWAFHHNPGALGELKEMQIGISYENRFLLKQLQSQGLVFAQPLKVGVISVGAQLYGFNEYRTQRIGAGYSMKLAEFLYAGVQLNYQGVRLNENYGTNHSVSAEAGVQAVIGEKWRVGVSVFNIGRAKLSTFEDDRYSTMMRLGAGYKVSEKVLILAEAFKNLDYKTSFKVGLEYQAFKNFYLRGGAASEPVEFAFGVGYKWKVIQLDIGTNYHQRLGWSPNVSFSYIANKKK
jgi:hypothetical protein